MTYAILNTLTGAIVDVSDDVEFLAHMVEVLTEYAGDCFELARVPLSATETAAVLIAA